MSKQETFIEFIDPEEIIEFIPDAALLEESNLPSPDSKDEVETEDDEIEVFRIAESIIEDAVSYSLKKKEDTRERLAIIYTVATLSIFIFVILISFIESIVNKTSLIQNLTTIIPLISGVLFGTLGFVLGYYFRSDSDRNNSNENSNNSRKN